MVSFSDPGLDKPAAIATALTGLILVLYFLLTIGNGEPANGLVFTLLLLGLGGAAWGTFRDWGRLTALWTAAFALCLIGLLTIDSIGAPLLVAGILCGVSGVRALPSLLQRR